MAYGDPNVYYNPENFGLTIVDSVEWSDENYQYDTSVVFHDAATGELFLAEDAGCSCPLPFDDYKTREALELLSGWAELDARLRDRLPEADQSYWCGPSRESLEGSIGELIQKVRAL